jgi:hypothetical protein
MGAEAMSDPQCIIYFFLIAATRHSKTYEYIVSPSIDHYRITAIIKGVDLLLDGLILRMRIELRYR